MPDQFPSLRLDRTLENWPFWVPNPLMVAHTPSAPPSLPDQPASIAAPRGGILGRFAQTIEKPPAKLGSEQRDLIVSDAPVTVTLPSVPFYGPGDVLMPRPQPAAPEPPKDFRTWLQDALSDENVRYYVGPHVFDVMKKLHALTQLLPGSGTVQSSHDTLRASEEAQAGNYGKAAAHLGMGTVNMALDWLPPAKLAIIGGTMAKTFPWNKLPAAMEMEAAGRSADEVWHATGLERAADGRWTFEIADQGYQIRPELGRWRGKGVKIAPLYGHHDHPGMRDAYPNLANWPSVMSVHPAQRIYGLFRPDDVLTVYGPTLPWARHVGIHELKHMIDSVERHPPGGSWRQFMGPGVSVQEAYGQSSRLVGEVAARNAQYRLDMKERERRLRAPRSTESVPRGRQINVYDDD
jgi:hypothetical protein